MRIAEPRSSRRSPPVERHRDDHRRPCAQPEHARLRLHDAAERTREVLVVEQRDRAAERAHAERDRRARRVLRLGIDAAARLLRIRDALDAERPVDQLRERARLDVAAGAAALAVLRAHVVRARRKPRAALAVAELHVRLPLPRRCARRRHGRTASRRTSVGCSSQRTSFTRTSSAAREPDASDDWTYVSGSCASVKRWNGVAARPEPRSCCTVSPCVADATFPCTTTVSPHEDVRKITAERDRAVRDAPSTTASSTASSPPVVVPRTMSRRPGRIADTSTSTRISSLLDVGLVRRLREVERLLHREDRRLAHRALELLVVVLAERELEPRDIAGHRVVGARQLRDRLHLEQLAVGRLREDDPRADGHVGMRAVEVGVRLARGGERERPVVARARVVDQPLERRVVAEHVDPLAQRERLRRVRRRDVPLRRAEPLVPLDARALVHGVRDDRGEDPQVPVIRLHVHVLAREEERVARLEVQRRARRDRRGWRPSRGRT